MAILIQQDYAQAGDSLGTRAKVRPQDIKSGTYYGQLQLRGSILVIKDAQNAVSGYIAFGTDITTIPTSPTTGTGIYIDYSILAGNNSGTKQFYLQSSDGKAYAGAGAVVLDTSGITITHGTAVANQIKWASGSDDVFIIYSENASGETESFVTSAGKAASDEASLKLTAITGDGAAHTGAASVYIQMDTAFNGGQIDLSAPAIVLTGAVTAQGAFTSPGIDDNANAIGITIDSTERVILTGTSTINHAGMNTILQGYSIATTAAAVAGASFGQFSADTRGSQINLSKSRNTSIALGTVVADGDTLGQILFTGDDGNSFDTGATIRAIVDGTPGGGDMPTRLELAVSADGSNSPTTRLQIQPDGVVIIGTGTREGAAPEGEVTNGRGDATTNADHLMHAFIANFTGTDGTSIQALEGYATASNASGNVGTLYGVIGHTQQVDAGTATTHKVFSGSSVHSNSCGAVTNVFIFKSDGIARIGTPGTITNAYGIYLDELPTSGVTNTYGVYQVGAGDINYFQGTVGIGETAPDAQLHITSSRPEIIWDETGSSAWKMEAQDDLFDLDVQGGGRVFRMTPTGSIVQGPGTAVATNATDGFLYISTCAGTPTGTPTTIGSTSPLVVDTTNNKMYFYSNGAWRALN